MSIQKYLVFIKTVELGSFTKAAEALGYSQSGISRMISDLERDWEVPLLERGRSGVNLTSDGLKLLPYAKNICSEHEKMQMQISEMHGLQSGLIRIGAFASMATNWLPDMIKRFKGDYPHIEYELLLSDYAEIENWILEGRVDCGFLRLPTKPELETVFLENDRLLVVLPEDHPMAKHDCFPASALSDETFILPQKTMEPEIAEIITRYRIKPKVQFVTCSDYAVMSMVECGLGISILPELMLKRTPYRIVAKELDVPVCRKICLAMRDKKNLSLAAKRFLDYLQYRNTPENGRSLRTLKEDLTQGS